MSMLLTYVTIITLILAIVIIGISGSGLAYKYEISRGHERELSDTIARQHILNLETCFKNEDIIKVRREKIKDKQISIIFLEKELDGREYPQMEE